jgi:hypothetical protein
MIVAEDPSSVVKLISRVDGMECFELDREPFAGLEENPESRRDVLVDVAVND